MAIDSREKRQAIPAIARRWAGVRTTPNAAKDVEWRQEVAGVYPQISAVTGPPVGSLAMMGAGR